MGARTPAPLGVFGGTFDPVHFGHLRPVAAAAAALALAQVRFIPAAIPPHRPPPVAPAAARVRMLELALHAYPGFSLETCELARPGPSYTVDTLTALRAECGAEVPLYLLLGSDAFNGLTRWHRWQMLPQLAHLVVMQRPQVDAPLPAWALPRLASEATALTQAPAGHVWLQAVPPQPISATAIRARLAAGVSVSGLMPDAVWQYIRENRLYQCQ